MKFALLLALLALTIQASKLKHLTKTIQGIESSTGLELDSVIDCLTEQSSKAIFKFAHYQIKFYETNDPFTYLFHQNFTKSEQEALDEFKECMKEGFQDITSQIAAFLENKDLNIDSFLKGDLGSANIPTVRKLAFTLDKNLKSKGFTKAGLSIGKTALKIVNQAVKYRDFNRKDTNISIFVNAFDNIILNYLNFTITKSVSDCYKTAKEFKNMYDFLHEYIDSIKNNSTLSDKGKKLLNSLKTVNKCKSNTKPGKQLTKAAGFDLFSDLSDKNNHFNKEIPNYIHFDKMKDGTRFGSYYNSKLDQIGRHGHQWRGKI